MAKTPTTTYDDSTIWTVLSYLDMPTQHQDEIRKKPHLFKKAIASVTQGDVDLYKQKSATIRQILKDKGHPCLTPEFNESETRIFRAGLCWGNPICNNAYNERTRTCQAVKNITPLRYCKGCCLVAYCSKACQTEDWINHKPICGKSDSPLCEKGPQRQFFGSTNKVTGEIEEI